MPSLVAADAIVAVADELDAELIAIGSSRHGAVASTLLGSVSKRVLAHSRRPVLVVHETPTPRFQRPRPRRAAAASRARISVVGRPAMKVQDVMTRDVLTIGVEASIRDVARVLVEHGISGLPVCDVERHVLGVVSEADILFKEHDPETSVRPGAARPADEGRRSGGGEGRAQTAGDAMTTPALTISPYRSVAEAARLMTEYGVNRLPVVKHEQLVGIVTRADLVRAFTRTDAEIETEISKELVERMLWLDPGIVDVGVERGHVTLGGRLPTRSDAEVLERLAARVPGVVASSRA